MTIVKTSINRRSFLKTTALAGGGLMIGFSWMASAKTPMAETLSLADDVLPLAEFELSGYIKIADNGVITLMAPNPEFGQNIKTSLPMLIAEDLDADWKNVVVEQAPHNRALYGGQFTGGSNGVRSMWRACRSAGATGRRMLMEAAAQEWKVPIEEITTETSVLSHKASGKSATYGAMASKAAAIPTPQNVPLKNVKDFKIIGTSRKNVDGIKIVTGKPLFGMDYQREGMLIAMITHAPAFGMKIKSVDSSAAKAMPGIKDVFTLDTYNQGFRPTAFDTTAFNDLVVVVGNTTWEVMNAKKALKIEWEPKEGAVVENSVDHLKKMQEMATKSVNAQRKDGDPETAFKNAAKIIERTYTAPFLAHNPMEPINFFAHVTADKAELAGPLQAPGAIEPTIAARIGLPADKIDFQLTRMGGGFGRRAYSHYAVEAAAISQKMNAPIKLIYTREDDMTGGIYRPHYTVTYRAALDANNNLVGFHVRGGGVPESAVSANRFPAGAVDNYLAESWTIPSNITVGAFRAPGSNFIAGAEQSFLDEVAEAAGKDPIEFRLALLERAKTNPVGQRNDYVADRYAGVLKLVKEKSNWGKPKPGVFRGVSAYFCHATYVAQVMDITMKDNLPVIEKVYCAVDCGIVVNPDAARNMGEGGIIDGIGNALFGEMTFKDGVPTKNNFNTYRMIRYKEAPKSIDIHFVEGEVDPTGLGEPLFPPTFAALANAMYKATGQRFYSQPFINHIKPSASRIDNSK